jgi:hypothetical protein
MKKGQNWKRGQKKNNTAEETSYEAIGQWKFDAKHRCRTKLIEQELNECIIQELWTDPIQNFFPEDEKNWQRKNSKYLKVACKS